VLAQLHIFLVEIRSPLAHWGFWSLQCPSKCLRYLTDVAAIVIYRYKLKDDVRESLYDACNEWTSALRKSGQKFMGGSCPNLADLVSHSVALCVVSKQI